MPRPATAAEPALYAAREAIYSQAVSGPFRRAKWVIMALCLGVYYLLPFVRWDRGPNAPSQAVLIDFPGRKFYFFFVEIWPQELYFITGLLVLAALVLFLMNAVAGRLWCGYLCPQTVWTDLFLTTERWIEGDRRERMKRDAGPWTADKLARKTAKHSVWLAIAWWTGGAWVLYFADAPTLVVQLLRFEAPAVAYAWIGILTATTYLLAGHAREQVCTYMCPWPRIQAALTDEHALNVMYRSDRGEPRMSLKQAAQRRAASEPAGDCIDCNQCVVVCPTGVDIRNGADMGCIQCGLCIDACDTVMRKVGRPERLIGYDTPLAMEARRHGLPAPFRPVRARTVTYAALILAIGGAMLWQLATRSFTYLGVAHDRNPIFVRLTDGAVRNAYTVNVSNKREVARSYLLSVTGLPGARVEIVGVAGQGGAPLIEVEPGAVQPFRVLVTAPPGAALPASSEIQFRLIATDDGERVAQADVFRAS
jgi:cytochrome c oxidase accessory protein FixG